MTREALTPLAVGERLLSSVRKPAQGSVAQRVTLPYHLMLVRDSEEKGRPWTASVEELPGCTSRGATSEEALAGIEAAMETWIATALEEGRDVPEPRSAASHSGRLLLRMPRTLHADLTRASEREGVSLNQFITDALAGAVVWRSGGDLPASTSAGTSTTINQSPGAGGLTAERPSGRRSRRESSALLTAALAANFIIVIIAGAIGIAVLITVLL
jgi:antitoxin HicB